MASIPTPLTNPVGPGFKTASLVSKDFGMSHELNGAAIVTVKTVGQAWNISVQYNTMTHAQFAPLDAFLTTLAGNMESFQIMLPQYRNPVGGAIGAIGATVRPASTYSGNTIVINDFTTITGNTNITAGSLIKFDNSPKVYKIASITPAGANATIVLNTNLYATITTANIPQFTDIEFTCKLDAAPTIVTNEDNLIEGFSLQMKETII